MCGIAGIFSPVNGGLIQDMTRAMNHRGPDGEGYYTDDLIALGHRRLSIIDIEGGAQPITNEDENLLLVCNGEIYNSPELREKLLLLGHQFRTKTDVEVILHLYEEYGEDCVSHLRGMFAFAIWDKKEKMLFMARDHMGQKPLFFYHGENVFLFASEIKAILKSGLVKPEIELNALWHYVSLRFIPDEYSLFKGIKKLPAATSLVYKDGEITSHQYWSPDFIGKQTGNEASIEEGLDSLLKETVNMHMLSDVRVGAFLSGGIDSSTVAAMMAESSMEEPIPTFSIGVKEQGFNELPYARMVVDKYGMEAHERIVQADLIHLIPSMIYHLDEPSDPFGVGVYLVSQVASEQVKVVLGGDGGDENFAGYDRFAGQRLVDYYCLFPEWFRKSVMTRIIDRIPESFGYKSLAQKATWLNRMSFFSSGERYAESMSFLRFTQGAKKELFTKQAQKQIGDYDSTSKILKFFDADNVDDLVDRMLYTDLMTRMPDHLLSIVDRMSMAHSIESRSPLMDYKMVEYAASIPPHMKLKGRTLKYILKKVAGRYLPDELINRKKQGFGFPLAIWMRADLKEFLKRLFAQSRLVEIGVFNSDYIFRMLEEHLSGKADHNFRLWILVNLEFWYRLYFDEQSLESLTELTDSLMA